MKRKSFLLITFLFAFSWLGGQTVLDSLNTSLEFALKAKDRKLIAEAYFNIGNLYSGENNNESAIRNFEEADKYYVEIMDIKQSAISRYNIGNSYFNLNEFPNALDNFQRALEIFDSLNFVLGKVAANTSLGLVYDMQEEYDKSIDYYKKALSLNFELQDIERTANIYNNLAIVMIRQRDDIFSKQFGEFWQDSVLLDKYKKNLNLFDEVTLIADSSIHYNRLANAKTGMAQAKITRNQVSLNKGDFRNALDEYFRILSDYSEVLSGYEISVIRNNMAYCYMRLGDYWMSEKMLIESKLIADEIGNKELRMHYYLKLSQLNSYRGVYKNALQDFKNYVIIKDSIFNEKKLKAIKDAEVHYETKAKEQKIVSLNRENQLKSTQFKYLIAGIILLSVLLFTAIRFWDLMRRSNVKIKIQKKEIDESIQAARDIQFAALPAPESLKAVLKDFFILFRPRNDVSGDFYWISRENGKLYVLTADCTGHGVPGAFLSMMGFALIQEQVALYPNKNAGFILNKLRTKLISSFRQAGKDVEGKQSMDVCLYIIDSVAGKMDFAGAMNNLYLFRKGELITYKGDRMPIGIHPNMEKPFKNYIIDILPEDSLFTFSDGFVDQCGGPEDSKFLRKNLLDLLNKNSHLPMTDIHSILVSTITDWQGDKEQTDDILVIGLRL